MKDVLASEVKGVVLQDECIVGVVVGSSEQGSKADEIKREFGCFRQDISVMSGNAGCPGIAQLVPVVVDDERGNAIVDQFPARPRRRASGASVKPCRTTVVMTMAKARPTISREPSM